MCVTIRGTQNNLGGKNIFTGNQKRKEKCNVKDKLSSFIILFTQNFSS